MTLINRIMLVTGIWLAVVILTSTSANLYGIMPIGKLHAVKYVKTIDGDTVIVQKFINKNIHVRLFGVDTAELKQGKSIAFQASQFTAVTLEHANKVYLELDPVALRDKYDRTLAWVWYREDGNLKLLNLELLRHNLAEIYWKCDSVRYRNEIMKYKRNKLE